MNKLLLLLFCVQFTYACSNTNPHYDNIESYKARYEHKSCSNLNTELRFLRHKKSQMEKEIKGSNYLSDTLSISLLTLGTIGHSGKHRTKNGYLKSRLEVNAKKQQYIEKLIQNRCNDKK